MARSLHCDPASTVQVARRNLGSLTSRMSWGWTEFVLVCTWMASSLVAAMNSLMGGVYSQYRLNTFWASSLQAV